MPHSPFDKKTVYHSALVKETQDNGPLEITLVSDEPEEGKFKGKAMQIAFKCYGDMHYYPIENEACGESLSGLKGKTVKIVASGRDDSAKIEVDGASGSRNDERGSSRREERQPERGREERQPQREQRREESPAPTKEERDAEERRAFSAAKVYAARCGVLMDICLHIAEGLAKKHLTESGAQSDPEDVRTMATTLFIETKNTVNLNKLPVKWIDKDQSQQRPPDREPEPKHEPPPPAKKSPYPDREGDAETDDIPF